MTRKRKKDIISPNNDKVESKRKMVTNTPSNNASNSMPANVGQSFILPPLYHPSSPYFVKQTSPLSYLTSTQANQNTSMVNNDTMQGILQRLDSMDLKLNQLNKIQSTVDKITERLNSMDSKINEIERSNTFLSEQYEELTACTDQNSKEISQLKTDLKSVKDENIKLKKANDECNDNIIDLKCRSMRDNLLFFGIPEGEAFNPPPVTITHNHVTHESQSTPSIDPSQPLVMESQSTESTTLYGAHGGSIENCADKCIVFCENILGISDAKSKISIERAHRIGRIVPGKVRPIVTKLDSQSKLMIKNALKIINLKNTVYNVADPYPSEVKERRKELIPVMLDARRQGKKAVLVRDKLFINNQL
ncbi:hypothetical protein ACF0H5_019469 [Mactra antiquata]